jgi:drug/metabolite transporter (DMT)-like permease
MTQVRGISTPGHAESAPPGVWLTDVSLVAMAVIWGVNYSVVKYGTDRLDPLAFNGLRIALAALALALVLIVRAARLPWPARRVVLPLIALGALGNGLYQLLFIEGIARTRAGDAALVLSAAPAFMAIIGRVRGVERIPARGVLGIALNMGGIALVVYGSVQTGTGTHASFIGDVILVGASLCWSFYSVLLKPYTHDVGGLQLSALTMIGGALPLVVIAAPALAATHWPGVPAAGWGAIVYSSLGALVVAYLFYYRGLRVIGPTRTAMYGNLQPLIALFVAWGTLGERPTGWQGFGAAFIMSGLFLTRT